MKSGVLEDTETKTNKALMWTLLIISLIQMPQFAILPGTNLIATEIFPERALQTVQTVMSLPGLVAVFAGVAAAMLVRYGFASKKTMTVFGLSLIALTGLIAAVLHTRFWQLCLMNILVGVGIGIFVPSQQSIMFDNFDEKTRQFISGVSFSFLNSGGLIMSLLCGWLTTYVWYGGHLQMLIAVPIVIIAVIIIPKDKKTRSPSGNVAVAAAGSEREITQSNENALEGGNAAGRSKIPAKTYYYSLLIVIFMIVYNVAPVNISTHLASVGVGNSSTAGVATAFLMVGGAVFGFAFPKLSKVLRDYLFAVSFILMAAGFTLMSLFPASLALTLAAMFLCGSTMSILVPRCIFNVSNLSDPTNSATATMLVCCIAPGGGHFLSPVIMTNLTMAFGGESTQYRFQFTAFVSLALAVIMFLYELFRGKATPISRSDR